MSNVWKKSTTAPAKLNFSLHIKGRRDDGYHLLSSLILRLNFGDDLRVAVTPKDKTQIRCNYLGDNNLAVKAVNAWLKHRKLSYAIDLQIEKHIWVGAGLGGGSSDAAATLMILEDYAEESGLDRLHLEKLNALGLSLGADIPFFLSGYLAARVQGIGEMIDEADSPIIGPLLLVNPSVELKTKDVFAQYDAMAKMRTHYQNDLDEAATILCPAISTIKNCLTHYSTRNIGLSGSGATVFAEMTDLKELEKAERALQSHGFLTQRSAVQTLDS